MSKLRLLVPPFRRAQRPGLVAAVLLVGLAGAGAGCLPSTSFHCEVDGDCAIGGAAGHCEATGFCSVDDGSCDSGRRYGDAAGDLAGECVAGEPPPELGVQRIAAAGAGGWRVLEGSGATWSSAFAPEAIDEVVSAVVWGDYDADGDPDLFIGASAAVAGGDAPYLQRIYRNDAPHDGTTAALDFTEVWRSDQIGLSSYVCLGAAWGDFDGDQDLDLIFHGTYPGSIVLRNDDGDFAVQAMLSTELVITSSDWGDVDGDHDLDLAMSAYEEKLGVWLGDGAGGFADPWIGPTADRTDCVTWGDLDGDGDLDLAASGDSFIRVLDNGGTQLSNEPAGVFERTGEDTHQVAWADVDGDGDPDLVQAADGAPLRVFENREGVVRTTPAWTGAASEQAQRLDLGDADGDGDLDLVVASIGLPLRILRNDSAAGAIDFDSVLWMSDTSDSDVWVDWAP